MECFIFLDAIGGTRCIPEKNGQPGPTGGNNFFLAEAYRCAFETEAAKSVGRVRPGSQVNMLFKSL